MGRREGRAERRRPIRTARVELDGDYAGTFAVVRLNPPFRVWDLFGDSIRQGLAEVVLEWNLVDDQGEAVELEPTLGGATDEELVALYEGYLKVLKPEIELPKGSPTPSGSTTPTST
jgi:hypothetical protein